MFSVVRFRKIPYIISSVLVLASIILLFVYGLKPGIDFTGGTLLELRFIGERPAVGEMQEALFSASFSSVQVQPTGSDGFFLRLPFITEEEHQALIGALRTRFDAQSAIQADPQEPDAQEDAAPDTQEDVITDTAQASDATPAFVEERLETIGPSISAQLRSRAFSAGLAVVIAIVFFVAYTFRKVSRPVSSWKYGITAIIALLHDVLLTLGVFSILGAFRGVEVDIPFVVALMTILGYSVNDTIVVFDRVRENLLKRGSSEFAETVDISLNQTFTRSLNTSLTTLLVLVALFLFGGASIQYFALALIVGIAFGSYSSLFLATPLLVEWERRAVRKGKE